MSVDTTPSTRGKYTPRATTYAGIKMRSRLEAAWAEQFDAMGWPWRYEPECFASPDGQYLPDFLVSIPGYAAHVYVEVKPYPWVTPESNGFRGDINDLDNWNEACETIVGNVARMHSIIAANAACDLFVIATSADDDSGPAVHMLAYAPGVDPSYELVAVAPSTCLLCGRQALVRYPTDTRCHSCYIGKWVCARPVASLYAKAFLVEARESMYDDIAERFRA
jgi:hypothetical protein